MRAAMASLPLGTAEPRRGRPGMLRAAGGPRLLAPALGALLLLAGPAGPAGAQDGGAPQVQASQPAHAPEAAPAATGAPAAARPSPRTAANATLPHDLSPWGMFLGADLVVKAVMVGLALASVITWTVWLAKSLELVAARRRLRRALDALEEARSLGEAARRLGEAGGASRDRTSLTGEAGAFLRAALGELDLSAGLPGEGVRERVASRFERLQAGFSRRMAAGTGLLATIGSTAPFVGLFGTVWGIMNSFVGISQAQTTNLAVVAPGIAEALLATAIGLVAAIPAVIIYNLFARAITGYRAGLADLSAAIMRQVGRDLDGAHRLRQAAE